MSNQFGFERGNYKVIRVDGSEWVTLARPNIREIENVIGAICLDSVVLTRNGREPDVVMLVDDTGMLDNKPPNHKATELYRAVCRPGTIHHIYGDVVLVHDGDFA